MSSSFKKLFNEYGLHIVLEELIDWVYERRSVGSDDEYLKIVTANLQKTLEDYKNRHQLEEKK